MSVDGSDESPSAESVERLVERIVVTVAGATGADPMALPPLYDAVDVEALDRLYHHGGGQNVSVTVEYAGCEVTVDGTDEVTVTEPAE